MGLWTMVISIVAIVTFGNIIKTILDKREGGDSRLLNEINDLKKRVEFLEGKGGIEARLTNVEKIVVDDDYALNREIKKALEANKTEEKE